MRKEIGLVSSILMIIVALAFDTLEVLLTLLAGIGLVLNRVVTIIEYAVFWLWFKLYGIDFLNDSKTSKSMISTFLAEMIPGVGTLPLFSIGVWWTIQANNRAVKEQKKAEKEQINQNIVRARKIRG